MSPARRDARKHSQDPIENGLLAVAASIEKLAESVDGLLYGLKYSKEQGMSIAESIYKGATDLAETLSAKVDDLVHEQARLADAVGEVAEHG